MTDFQWFLAIVIMSVVTYFVRALPFLVFSGKKEVPETVKFLGEVLPYSIMGLLVVYALKDVNFTASENFMPELISIISIIFIHKLKRNTFLSIFTGTLCYMILVQNIFI